MKALTVKQPWAWAIAHGGKNIENRMWRTGYRGPLAIHAGLTDDEEAIDFRIAKAWAAQQNRQPAQQTLIRGAIIATASLKDCHLERDGCCQPWGEPGAFHFVLADIQPLVTPVPCRGALNLWNAPVIPPEAAA